MLRPRRERPRRPSPGAPIVRCTRGAEFTPLPYFVSYFVTWRSALVALLAMLAVPPPVVLAGGDFATPYTLVEAPPALDAAPGITLRGALMLHPARLPPPHPHEMSGLAWDADAACLYAVTDNGLLVHLEPRFEDGRLRDLRWLATYPLRDADGTPLSGRHADAEGLVARHGGNGIVDDTELVVSFERVPRLARYTPDGRLLGSEPLPTALAGRAAWAGANLQLEALTEHPALGLVMAPERPLRDAPQAFVTLYAAPSRQWQLAAFDAPAGTVVGLETMSDGALLLLERRYVNLFFPIRFSLRRLELPPAGGTATARTLAVLDNTAGWSVDNFESVARHGNVTYFMVSDDNRHPLQHTLLVYFAVNEAETALPRAAFSVRAGAASTRPGCTDACGNRADGR